MNFSERYHLKPVTYKFQEDEVDKALRTRLWNVLTRYYWSISTMDSYQTYYLERIVNPICPLAIQIQEEYFNRPLDAMGTQWATLRRNIHDGFFTCIWYKVYDFIEFLISTDFIDIYRVVKHEYKRSCFFDDVNEALEKEQSASRLVGRCFIKITDKVEQDAVNQAVGTEDPYAAVRIHIENAVKLLADRQNPDYRNSVKESISAVEAVCKILTGDEHATLGQALKRMDQNGMPMHKAFKESISKLYGYTSDAGGIRHCLTDASAIDFADAKYMLVVCSAFSNYMVDKCKAFM